MRKISSLMLMLTAVTSQAVEPAGLLNDTGQTRCLDAAGTALEACSAANSGDLAPFPGQDGRFGRDAAYAAGKITKIGGGLGSFDFTPLDVDGHEIAVIDDGHGRMVPASTPRCVKDNRTHLVWEVKTLGGIQHVANSFFMAESGAYPPGFSALDLCFQNDINNCTVDSYISQINQSNLCGTAYQGGPVWRLPTRRELMTLVDRGRADEVYIDAAFFPNIVPTYNKPYWTSDEDWFKWEGEERFYLRKFTIDFQTGNTEMLRVGWPNTLTSDYGGSLGLVLLVHDAP